MKINSRVLVLGEVVGAGQFGRVTGAAGEFVAVTLDDDRVFGYPVDNIFVLSTPDSRECRHAVVGGGRCVRCSAVVIPRACGKCGARTTLGRFNGQAWNCIDCLDKSIREKFEEAADRVSAVLNEVELVAALKEQFEKGVADACLKTISFGGVEILIHGSNNAPDENKKKS